MRSARHLSVLGLVAVSVACAGGGDEPEAAAIRLIDRFDATLVSGSAPASASARRTEFRFDGAAPVPPPATFAVTRGAEAGPGVAELVVRDGVLAGRSTDDFPVIRLQRTSGLDSSDTLHAVEIRMRVSAGANLSMQTFPNPSPNLEDRRRTARTGVPWPLRSPLQPGADLQTYLLSPLASTPMSRIRELLIRPTDAAGATFAIESVRLITRTEHLASIPAGVGWQGLSEIYRESLVAHAPEVLRFDLTLPSRPWLDLAVGTPELGAVTFRVTAAPAGSADASQTIQTDFTVTRPHQWAVHPIDLTPLAGRAVTLALELRSEKAGALGFWGSPVLRARGAAPATDPAAADAAAGPPPQGVIFIHADTLRRDHLDLYGHDRQTAPFLTRMAKDGVAFRNAISQASWTKVSTTSMVTGLYPTTHGVRLQDDRLPSSATTLAEVFKAAGYATFATSSVAFTGQYTNLHQGVEELHENGSLSSQGTPLSAKTSREYVDRLVAWVERHRDVPFFAYLHVFDPHHPYEPYAPYNTAFGDPARGDEHKRQRDIVSKIIASDFMRPRQLPTREEIVKSGFEPAAYVQQELDWYDGSIRGLDVELARLVEQLQRMGLDERTLIVLTSDHGTEFLEHGRFWHGQSVYGELINIPLVVRWPSRVPGGRVVDDLVQSIDIMPTVLGLSGLAVPEGVQGQTLQPFFADGAAGAAPGATPGWQSRPAVSERAPTVPSPDADQARISQAIIDANWKLVHNTTLEPGLAEIELFDYAKDPLNMQNVAASHPEVVARLRKLLDGWRQMATAARLKPDAETTKALSAEELQRLRSLGYIR